MKACIHRYLLQPLKLAFEVCKPAPVPAIAQYYPGSHQAPDDATVLASSTVWALDGLRLRAGWYMLAVEHSAESIGCTLTLEVASGERESLLLTSKPVCKRIVQFGLQQKGALIQIDQPDCSLSRVTLTALSERFAISRLSQRLRNRGSPESLDALSAQALYRRYRKQMHDGLFPQVYKRALPDIARIEQESQNTQAQQSAIRLVLLHCAGNDSEGIDSSVDAAFKFGLKCGWHIEWHGAISAVSDAIGHGTVRFLMPILSGVEYRLDIFHQMLASVEAHTRLVYADHDHVDAGGDYINPVLKPEWNPELLLNLNYIQLPWMIAEAWSGPLPTHGVLSMNNIAELLLGASLGTTKDYQRDELSGSIPVMTSTFAQGFESTAKPALEESEVIRIPQILASVRVTDADNDGSAFAEEGAWPVLVGQALRNAGSSANVVASQYQGRHRIKWPCPVNLPSVDIIIPTRDKVSVLRTCVESIVSKTSYANYRLMVVDNDSQEAATERYYQIQSANPRFTLLRFAGAFNYSAINNFAVSQSDADIVVLLNNDTEVLSAGWLDEMVRQSMRRRIGCVGAKLYYSNGRMQHGGVIVGLTGIAGHAHRYSPGDAKGYCDRLVVSQNFSAVTAACLAVRRSIWNEAGGLDALHLGVAWNDVDFCLKVQALGYSNLWTPYAELFHHEGLSRGADNSSQQRQRVKAERKIMLERWRLEDVTDPAYHPLLTRDNESFSLGDLIS